jgi:surface polysaccharide O-acyltransferase-like enzyme
MRIFACFGVIMIHAAVFDQASLYNINSWKGQWINIWGVLSRWAVPAFVMLSGMMILPKADETSVIHLMWRRVIRMLMVYVIWSAVYSVYNVYVLDRIYAPTKLKTFIDGCFSGELHMWYIPMITGLYIVSPILAVLVKKLEKRWAVYWLSGMFLFSSVIPFLIKLDIKFISTILESINGYMDLQFLGGWTLYFVLGYYIRQHDFSKKEKFTVYVLALAALAFTLERTVLYGMRTGAAFGIQNYEYPNIYLMGIGIMVFFKEEVSRLHLSDVMKKFIAKLSGLTFGIYLSHVLLLRIFCACGINLQLAHPALSIPAVGFFVFVTGALLTWIIHKIPVVGKYIS